MDKKILLIGSSPIIKYYKLGTLIDSFEGPIVRFNSCQVKGFEEFVGSRTDVLSSWNLSACIVHKGNGNVGGSSINIETLLDQTNRPKKFLIAGYPGKGQRERFYQVGEKHQIEVEEIGGEIKKQCSLKLKEFQKKLSITGFSSRGSAGLLTTAFFLDKGYLVYYHGFSHFNKDVDLHYYHEGKFSPESRGATNHSGVEKEWFDFYRKESALKKFIKLPGL